MPAVNANSAQVKRYRFAKLKARYVKKHESDVTDKKVCKMLAFCPSKGTTFEASGRGNLEEVQRLVANDRSRLHVQDARGRIAIHYAAKNGHANVIEYMCNNGADINAQDNTGSTPLHVAVENSQKAAVDSLLRLGACTRTPDNKGNPVLMKVVEVGDVDILKTVLAHAPDSVHTTSPTGSTALHAAAYHNRAECARILLENGAKLCRACDIGVMPIHVAAKCSSHETLQVFLDMAQKLGYTDSKRLLCMKDNSANMPLHSAIASGDIKSIETCLLAQASIADELDDHSNAVHMVCAQGSVDMLKMMFEMQPDNVIPSIHARDVTQMTPLHKAALFNKCDMIQVLLDQGADIDPLDMEGRTPMLVSASSKASNAVVLFISKGANIHAKDHENRNVLHLLVRSGARPDSLQFSCKSVENSPYCRMSAIFQKLKELLNDRDVTGCTPLHYASREGRVKTIDELLRLGALVTTKTNNQESPLHFAARYGRLNTCHRLLECSVGHTTQNEVDSHGDTALHLAASEGHQRVVSFLLGRGATILRNEKGNSPLHSAAIRGCVGCLSTILSVHYQLLNIGNKHGDTALHLAAEHGNAAAVTFLLDRSADIVKNAANAHFLDIAIQRDHKDVCIALASHDRWKEVLHACSSVFGCSMIGLVRHQPDVCQVIADPNDEEVNLAIALATATSAEIVMVLDRCITRSPHNEKSKELHYTYDFTFLQLPLSKVRELKERGEEPTPLFALHNMVQYNRVDCLSHPVCTTFLRMKWRAYGVWVHTSNLLVYFIYLMALTAFVCTYDVNMWTGASPSTSGAVTVATGAGIPISMTTANATSPDENASHTGSTRFPSGAETTEASTSPPPQMTTVQSVFAMLVLIFCVLNMIKEIFQMIQQKSHYFLDMNNILEWVMYVTSSLFLAPFFFGTVMLSVQWQCGAVAIFLAWFNLLLFLQRFDFYGIYVVMFLEILTTLVQALVVFSILIIAFGLSFYSIFSIEKENAYKNPGISIVSTILMMTGTVEYMSTWVDPTYDGDQATLPYPVLAYVMLILFIIFMPILLMNLLIGLAVGNIDSVKKDARLKRLAMQVQLHMELERKMPQRCLEYVDKPTWKVFPNRSEYTFTKIWHRITRPRGLLGDGDECLFDGGASGQSDDYIYNELYAQRKRMQQLSTSIDKSHELLRLIVQKMEISTEADNDDETDQADASHKQVRAATRWSSQAVRKVVMTQASAIAKFKSFDR